MNPRYSIFLDVMREFVCLSDSESYASSSFGTTVRDIQAAMVNEWSLD